LVFLISPAMHSRCGPQIIGISANGKWQREWKISQRRLMLLSIKACRALLSASLIMEYAEDCCYSSILRCGFVCTKHLIERLRPRTLETRMSETNSSRPATGAPLQLIGGSRWYGRLQLSPCITFNRPKAGPLNRLGSTKTLWLTSGRHPPDIPCPAFCPLSPGLPRPGLLLCSDTKWRHD
jgi:hypothetical protein